MKRYFLIVLAVLAFGFPLVYVLKNVLSGSMAFWYDPARDMLLALGNLSKLTLIGPPSGIPGIFYGPYWIWFLSFGMIFSKDPKIVTLITETIPYFTIFPLLLFQFRKLFGIKTMILIWLLFIFNFSGYAIQLWNPNLAPLLFLAVLYITTFTDFYKKEKRTYLKTFFLGLVTAFTFHFHISFGLGLTLGIFLFFLLDSLIDIFQSKKRWRIVLHRGVIIACFLTGFLLIFLPFFAFEYRHGFQQSKVAIATITSPVAVVGQQGLNKIQITEQFFGRLAESLKLPSNIMIFLSIAGFLYILFFLEVKKFDTKNTETKLLFLLVTVSTGILCLYLTSKNPVWNYHFVAVEIIFLLIIAFFANKFSVIKLILTVYVGFLFILNVVSFANSFSFDSRKLTSLASKEYVVEQIMLDAKGSPYIVYIYNPAIYNYDYAYLFQIKGKDVPYDPGKIVANTNIVYLIIPNVSQAEKDDFINYRGSKKVYTAIKTWQIADGSTIIKIVRNTQHL